MFTKKEVDKIVWWIPFKRLRDFIRSCFYMFLELYKNYSTLTRNYNTLIKNHEEVLRKCNEIKNNSNEEYRILYDKISLILEKNYPQLRNENGMLIIRVGGGLADQILHYAIGTYVQMFYNKKVKYDITRYGKNIKGVRNSNRNFELLNINEDLDFEVASSEEIELYKYIYSINLGGKNIDQLMSRHKNLYTIGHMGFSILYRNPKVLEHIKRNLCLDEKLLLNIQNTKNMEFYKKITESLCSVAIHIRRGDYIEYSNRHGLYMPDENYFLEAIDKIKSILITPPRQAFGY